MVLMELNSNINTFHVVCLDGWLPVVGGISGLGGAGKGRAGPWRSPRAPIDGFDGIELKYQRISCVMS